jgi:hypothetical protein
MKIEELSYKIVDALKDNGMIIVTTDEATLGVNIEKALKVIGQVILDNTFK